MGRRVSTGWFRRRRAATTLAVGAVVSLGLPLANVMPAQAAPAPLAQQTQAAATGVSVLVFHGPTADQKDPVLRASDAIARLGQDNGIAVTSSSDPGVFNAVNLAKYRGVVLLSAQGVEFTREQETALQNYIKAGNGFLGVSDTARAQEGSEWFTG